MNRLRSSWMPLALALLVLSAQACGQEPASEQEASATPPAGRAAAAAGETPAPRGRTQGARGQAGAAPEGRALETPPPAEEGDLVFEREVFRYPTFQRRNPFRPLVGDEAGPRFEQMELRGVIYSDDPRQSVALLGLRGRVEQRLRQQVQRQIQQQDAGTAPPQMDTIVVPEASTRLKVGQTWGNVRVVQIARDHVVLDVTDFGLTERRTLAMMILRPGGP
jgi:hypothetical protein